MKTICTFLCVGVVLICASVMQADEGFPDPISIDRESPSVMGHGHSPGDIYDWVGPPGMGWDIGGPGPQIHVPDVAYGLWQMQDNNDAHSNGEDPNGLVGELPMYLYFSGHDNRSLLSGDCSMGLLKTDYLNQAVRNQAAGDRFMVNGTTTIPPRVAMNNGIPSAISPPIFPGGLGNFPTNLLTANQTNYNEIPSIPENVFNGYMSPVGADRQDDMDALEITPFDLSGDRVHNTPIFFSLDRASPSLNPPGFLPADILLSPPGVPSYHQYAPAPSLGLTREDDLDALAIWPTNLDLVNPGQDYALFSLAPSSKTLWGPDGAPGIAGVDDDGFNGPDDLGEVGFGDDLSPADIFVTDFTGIFQLYLKAGMLGMRRTDNVDAIDVETMQQPPIDQVSAPTVLGDFNLDGVVNVSDLGILATHYGIPAGMKWANGDANGDEAVNVTDLGILATFYGTVTVAATVPEPSTTIVLLTGLAGLLLFRRR